MAADGRVRIGPGAGFPPGTKLELVERIGLDVRDRVKTAKVDRNSEAEFKGLEPGQTFSVRGEVDGETREVLATSKPANPDDRSWERPETRSRQDPDEVRRQLREQAQSAGSVGTPVSEGLRSTANAQPKGRQQPRAAGEGVDPKRAEAARKAARTRKANAAKAKRSAAGKKGARAAAKKRGKK